MTALTTQAFNVLNGLSVQLGVEHRFSLGSGDAASDVNGWLGFVLRDENRSAKMTALRATLQTSMGSNVPLTEGQIFAYYQALLSATPLTIWQDNVLEWGRTDLGSSATALPDQSKKGAGYTGTCTKIAGDVTLNGLDTINTNGSTQALFSALSLPNPNLIPITVLAVANPGTFAGTQGFFIDDSVGSHTCAVGTQLATKACFANSGPNLIDALYGSWQLFRGSFFAGNGNDTISVGPTEITDAFCGGHLPAAGRRIGTQNGQQVRLFELIYLRGMPSKPDLALYKGYLDALTANTVLHT